MRLSVDLLADVATKFKAGKDLYKYRKEQAFIDEMYPSCPNISIDYGIAWKKPQMLTCCAPILGWTDLGIRDHSMRCLR